MYLPERQFLAVNYPLLLDFFNGLVKDILDDAVSYNGQLLNNIII